MKNLLLTGMILSGSILIGFADKKKSIPSQVDYRGFVGMTQEVQEYREGRLVGIEKFNAMAKEKGTIILDTRSKWAFDAFHIKGAVHLNFSDFTNEKLAKVIPLKTTRILIYCNNNFANIDKKPAIQSKMVELALNIPTFINLYGYGYKNIYELSENLKVTDKRLDLVEKPVVKVL